MNKRISSGLAALIMVVSSAGYLPADTFGMYSGTIRASASDQEVIPDNYTLFISGNIRLEMNEATDWGTVETAYEFERTVDWEHVYDMKKLVVKAKITSLSEDVNSPDVRSTVFTMNDNYTHWCDSGYYNFNDKGELEYTVDVTPDVFNFDNSEEIDLEIMGLQFQLEPDRINDIVNSVGYNYADIEFSVYTVDSGITDGYTVVPVRYNSDHQGEVLAEGLVCMDLTELDNTDGYCFLDEKIKKITGFDALDNAGELVLQVKERASSMYDDFDFNRIRVGLFTKTEKDGTLLTSEGNITDRQHDWDDYELCTEGSKITRPEEGTFEGLYFRAFAENVTDEEIENCKPKIYLQYRLIKALRAEEMFTYEVIDNETCRITGLKSDSSDITIPFFIDGYKVIGIADEAFKDADLTSCNLSSGITEIGKRAFEGNPRLKKLYISNDDCTLDEFSVGFDEDGVVNKYFTLECSPFGAAAKYAAVNGIRAKNYMDEIDLPCFGSEISNDNLILRSDMRTGENEIAWVRNYQFDVPSWPPAIEEVLALKKMYLEAATDATAEGLSPEDFAAAIFTMDAEGNIHKICDTVFDKDGRISAQTDVLEELLDPDSTGELLDFGIMVYLVPSAVSKLDQNNPRQNLAHIQIRLSFNDSAYDPGDFTFPEVDGSLRDNFHDRVVFWGENGYIQKDDARTFRNNVSWSNVYSEWRWVVQTHLTYLPDCFAPTDLTLTLFGTDQDTGKEISVSVPFDENGYAMIDSYVNRSFFGKNGTATVSEFGYKISADETVLAALGESFETEAQYDVRIYNVNDIPSSEEGKLVLRVNEWESRSDTNLYLGSWKLFKEREGMKLTGKISHLPDGLSFSDFNVILQAGPNEGTIATLVPDEEGKITFEKEITDELFNSFSNNSYSLNLCFSLKDDKKAAELYDYAILEYETEYENGTKLITVGDYTIAVYGDSTAVIIDYTGTSEEVTVPSKIAGYDVVSIGAEAFSRNNNLKKVTLSEGIKELEDNALSWCYNLKEISLPESLTRIGGYVFAGCGLESVTLPKNLKVIDAGVFFESSSLKSVTIPDGLEQMGPSVFAHCPKLTDVNFPAGINMIPEYTFVDSGIEEISLPDTVKVIGNSAFAYCSKLRKAVLPEGLESIEENAFLNSGLEYIVIPKTVNNINGGAFKDCKSLEYAAILNNDVRLNTKEEMDYSGTEPVTVYTQPFDNGVTLRSFEGSTAETFAAQNTMTFRSIREDDGGFDDPEYSFNKDDLTVTAERFCYLDPEKSENETADVTVEDKPADCKHFASTEYTAVFTNNAFNWSYSETGNTLTDHNPGEPQQENLDPVTGEYDLVTRCTYCGDIIESTHVNPNEKHIVGDANDDGVVNRIDANLLSRYVAGWDGYDQRVDLSLCDLNGDGDVNRIDANVLSRCVADWDGYKDKYIRPKGQAPRT